MAAPTNRRERYRTLSHRRLGGAVPVMPKRAPNQWWSRVSLDVLREFDADPGGLVFLRGPGRGFAYFGQSQPRLGHAEQARPVLGDGGFPRQSQAFGGMAPELFGRMHALPGVYFYVNVLGYGPVPRIGH
jgi:hypothetical protein